MDRIAVEERDSIRKTSSERLRARLEQEGWPSDELVKMDRESLMNAVAELYIQPSAGAVAAPPQPFVENMTAKEMELRERELALREREIYVQQQRWEAEIELKRAEHERLLKIDADRAKQEASLAARTKKFADSIKHVLVKMSDDPAELPMFFAGVENLYKMYEIPVDLQAKLLLPWLSKKARVITNRLSLRELDDYNVVKQRILTEFRLTSREYLSRFQEAQKQSDESYVYFRGRLQNLLRYYLQSRNADDFEKVVDVLVSDRLKETLSPSTLNYVLSLEGDNTFSSEKVAATADIHMDNCRRDGGCRSVPRQTGASFSARGRENVSASTAFSRAYGNASIAPQGRPKRLCHKCKSDSHLYASCPMRTVGRNNEPARVHACMAAERCVEGSAVALSDEIEFPVARGQAEAVRPGDKSGVGESANVQSSVTYDNGLVRLVPLTTMKVLVNDRPLEALIDSGAQVVLLNGSVLSDDIESVGTFQVQGVFGDAVRAEIVPVDVKRCNDDIDDRGVTMQSETMQIFCGLVNNIASGYDMILPAEMAEEIMQLPLFHANVRDVNSVYSHVDVDHVDSVNSDMTVNNVHPVSVVHNTVTDNDTDTGCDGSDALIDEQRNDATLVGCHKLAAAGKGGFVYRNGVLYRSDRICGQRVWQLVVPCERRAHVLKLAHETGAHLGIRKTSERIKLSFWWNGIKDDVQKFVTSCHSCQLRRRLRSSDRVPITPITRASRPFEMVVMDVIGPIEPPAGPQKFKYVLCIVDSFSRFPSAYLLKDLTAKSACQALLEFFSWAGVSSVVISDNATNFNNALTKEFMNRMGCSPRFSSPNHPECQGICERFNQTFKNMLHHAIREHGSKWHLIVPFLVWAMRESRNETTNMSPYMCVYGFTPKGPLSILQENWAGLMELPPNFGKSASDYMQELKQNLETVSGYVSDHAANAQERYAYYYNLRARDKHFDVGDLVIVLSPDYNFSRTYARWIGPATIAEVKSPYSYIVEMPDGSTRHFHANKLRPYVARVSSVGVINDSDVEFGFVSTPDTNKIDELKPSEKLPPDKIAHLTPDQRNELLEILDKYPECFSDQPGYCDAVYHEIKLKPGFTPKQSKSYRIPEILKPEVEKQINKLVQDGFLVPSKSPMSSPILCVLKPSKEVRIVCDFRYVNSFTVADAFPVPRIDEVLDKVGRANLITTWDARGAYWQVPVSPIDRWLTAIVTPSGLWEWTRTPFGMRNSGNTFVRTIQMILRPISDFTSSYVDDMAVGSVDWHAHLNHIDQFLSVVKSSGLTLNLLKCEFAKSEVKFVGHYVGSGFRRPDPEKFKVIQDMERPVTQKELRSILGLFGYFRDYIAGYAQLAKPLTDLTSKSVPNVIPWGENEQKAFTELKHQLCKISALAVLQPGKPVTIFVDASVVAVGACAFQADVCGLEKPIAYMSQKLTPAQTKWSTIEREAFAVICALQKWHAFVFGVHTVVYSDHNPLTYVVNCAPKSARLTRWALALQQYDIELRYKKGKNNIAADCLSRLTLVE